MSRNQRIHNALSAKLKPEVLKIKNESNQHHVPEGSETHFKIIAVSTSFISLNRVTRHRLVNSLIAEEFKLGLHALSLHLYTPAEWEQQGAIPDSPRCRNGMRHG